MSKFGVKCEFPDNAASIFTQTFQHVFSDVALITTFQLAIVA